MCRLIQNYDNQAENKYIFRPKDQVSIYRPIHTVNLARVAKQRDY